MNPAAVPAAAQHEAAVVALLKGLPPETEYPFYPEDSDRMRGRRGRSRTKGEVQMLEVLPEVIASSEGAGEQVFADWDECNAAIEQAGLTERERVAYLAKNWWGQDVPEVAKLIGCTRRTVERAYSAAAVKLAALPPRVQ